MKLGVFTPVFATLPFPEMLDAVRALRHVTALELGTGGWPGSAHLDPDALLACPTDARTYRQRDRRRRPDHQRPLVPRQPAAPRRRAGRPPPTRSSARRCALAEQLDVPVVVTFSGCPGDGPDARHPNWVTTPWPPEFSTCSPGSGRSAPSLTGTTRPRSPRDHGVKVALEPHPGFLVYNVETALRLARRGRSESRRQLRPEPLLLAGHGPGRDHPGAGRSDLPRPRQRRGPEPGRVALNGVLDTKSYRELASGPGCSAPWAGDTTSWRGSRWSARCGSPATTTC